MKIISRHELSQVDPTTECFIIKSVFTPEDCEGAYQWLSWFLTTFKDNERGQGQNWHYRIDKEGMNFHSFMFNELKKIENKKLVFFYRTLFDLYRHFGECLDLDFDAEIGRFDQTTKTINPLIFWYPSGIGKFKWHQHPGTYQKFQLLCNLTRPGVDYVGGETLVQMGDITEEFDSKFGQGDVFSFPYTKRHMVNEIGHGNSGKDCRVSLLMPSNPRVGYQGVSY